MSQCALMSQAGTRQSWHPSRLVLTSPHWAMIIVYPKSWETLIHSNWCGWLWAHTREDNTETNKTPRPSVQSQIQLAPAKLSYCSTRINNNSSVSQGHRYSTPLDWIWGAKQRMLAASYWHTDMLLQHLLMIFSHQLTTSFSPQLS